jgi:kumamolisin
MNDVNYFFFHSRLFFWLGVVFMLLIATNAHAETTYVPHDAIKLASHLGRMESARQLALTLSLPIRNPTELADLIHGLYDIHDPNFGHYLAPEEFASRFAPTPEQYDQLAQHFMGKGFAITNRHSNRLLLELTGSVDAWESMLQIQLHEYRNREGKIFHAPDREPQLPPEVFQRILHLSGLDNHVQHHSHVRIRNAAKQSVARAIVGSGPNGGLTPDDILKAYSLSTIHQGNGQTLGLLELAAYDPSDISAYQAFFGLPTISVENISVSPGIANSRLNADAEATLDIELQMALAPDSSKILVYQAPNQNDAFLAILSRIATDNKAKQISISWGLCEADTVNSYLQSENQIFQQMAVQGQTVFAAAGDNGAYDCGTSRMGLAVDDPASQPYVTGVGGTTLNLAAGGNYASETTWNAGSIKAGAGGGGVSSVWPIPDYQKGVAGLTSTLQRNVPDVALNADPNIGYSIYFSGTWQIYGGTSAAAPLWSALIAHLNQERSLSGLASVGSFNGLLYQAAKFATPVTGFHDIADNSNNLYYVAKTGYDNATGWGSFQGDNLLGDLLNYNAPPVAPSKLIASPGDSSVTLSWHPSPAASGYNVFRGTSAGYEAATPINQLALTGSAYRDANLVNGVTYYYTVRAFNAIGSSTMSSEVSATPEQTFPVTVSRSGKGRITSKQININCGSKCATMVAAGSQAIFTATPAVGYGFASWEGDCNGSGACAFRVDAPTPFCQNCAFMSPRKARGWSLRIC